MNDGITLGVSALAARDRLATFCRNNLALTQPEIAQVLKLAQAYTAEVIAQDRQQRRSVFGDIFGSSPL